MAFVAIGFSSVMAPPASPDDASATSFSATRAFEHVEVLAREPHPMGSPAIRKVRAYLVAELEELGLEPVLQAITVPSYYEPGGPVEVVNVHATVPGRASTGTIVLVAHYDTVPTTPGANDNSAGVATLLEAGRALLAQPRPANDVVLLFTDGEEPAPRYGSSTFVDLSPIAADVALVVNLEANGGSGPSMLAEISGPEGGMVARFAAAVPDPIAFSFIGESLKAVGEVGTDFDPFRNAGVPGFNLAYLRGSPIYHTPADDLDSVSLDSLQHHGSNAVGLVEQFGNVDLGTKVEDRGTVYFTLRPLFVQYPAWLSVGVSSSAAALVLLTVSRRRGEPHLSALARSVGRAAGSVLLVAVAMTLVWLLIAVVRSSPSVWESYLYLVVLVGGGAVAVARRGAGPSASAGRGPLGFVVIWVLLGLVTSFAAPGFSYLFVWPALAAALVTTWPTEEPMGESGWAGTLRFAIVAGPTIVLHVPAIEFFFQLGQPRPGNPDSSIPFVAAVAFLLAALASGLILEFSNRRPNLSRRRGGHVILAMLLVTVAASCGGDDNDAASDEDASPSSASQSTTTAADSGWVERDVAFPFGDALLHGVLTTPADDGVHPAIVLISGSAGPDGGRAGASASTFIDHSHRLASRGFAVLRYDPPGMGRSTGETGLPSLERRREETAAALAFLRTEPSIADESIGLLGVSQGGWVIAMTAAAYPEDVAFLVSVVGSGQSVAQQQLYGIEAQSRAAGLAEGDVEKAVLFGRLLLDLQLTDPAFQELNEADAVALGDGPWTDLLALVYDPAADDSIEGLRAAIEIMTSVQDEPWAAALYLRELYIPQFERIPDGSSPEDLAAIQASVDRSLTADPKDFLTDVRVPVLAFFGERDLVVDTETSSSLYEQYLAEAGNDDVTIVVIPGIGHDITIRTPGYWDTLSDWLTQRYRG